MAFLRQFRPLSTSRTILQLPQDSNHQEPTSCHRRKKDASYITTVLQSVAVHRQNSIGMPHANMDFSPLNIRLNATCAADQIFIKPHVQTSTQNTEEDAKLRPAKRTLLAVGIPPWCNDENTIRSFFTEFGEIVNVFVQDTPGPVKPRNKSGFVDAERHNRAAHMGFKVAYIVFRKREGATAAIEYSQQQTDTPLTLINADELPDKSMQQKAKNTQPPLLGPKKWFNLWHSQARRNVDEDALMNEINAYMSDYDAKKAEEKQKEKQMESEPDADGWVTVSRHGRKPTISRTEALKTSVFAGDQQQQPNSGTKSAGRRGKRMPVKEPDEIFMYKHQAKESKMDQLAEMRRKFDEDRKKLALMKATRKFKPY